MGEESESNGQRIRIKVPEYYRPVNEEVWVDLEAYVYQGFLVSSAFMYDKTFVFKTLNHHELRYVQYLKPLRTSALESKDSFRAVFIAHSLFMVDGENVLISRAKRLPRLIKTISKIDRGIQDKIMEALSSLNERAARLHPLAEIYVHENRSRYRWMHARGTPVHSVMNTGVPGTDEIGMNYCQQAWTALNELLDARELMEREWTNAKFIGSCFAGKGVRSIDERDRARRERERTEQEDLKMKVLHSYLNRKPGELGPTETVDLPDGRKASVVNRFRAESAEQLAEQLSAALSGEKDHHDMVVEAKVKKLRERAFNMEEDRRRIFRSPGIDLGAANPAHPGSRVLGGREEAEALLGRLRVLQKEQIAKYHRQTPGDREGSDEEPKGSGEA